MAAIDSMAWGGIALGLLLASPPTVHAQLLQDRWEYTIPPFAELAADTVVTAIGTRWIDPEAVRLVDRTSDAPWCEEGLSEGITTRDLDQDGRIDIFVARKSSWLAAEHAEEVITRWGNDTPLPASTLYWNLGDGRFEPHPDQPWPANVSEHHWIDLDNDGRLDLLTRGSRSIDLLREWKRCFEVWRQPAPRVLVPWEFPAAIDQAFEAVASFDVADLDRDGRLDLVVLRAVAGSMRLDALRQTDTGEFVLEPIADFAGDGASGVGHSTLVHALDLDEDGGVELLLIDAGPYWQNRTRSLVLEFDNGRWSQPRSIPSMGVATYGSGSFADVDHDGVRDAFFGQTDYFGGKNVLLRSRAPLEYEAWGVETGLHAGYRYTAGMVWGDLDHDGRLDGVQSRFLAATLPTRSVILVRMSPDLPPRFGTLGGPGRPALEGASRAASLFDADGDGDLDLAVTRTLDYRQSGSRSMTRDLFLENRSRSGHWIQLDLVGTDSPRCALGARIELVTGAQVQFRWVGEGGVRGRSGLPLRVHFGWNGEARVDRLEVRWTSGRRESWSALEANRLQRLVEGTGVSAR